MNNIKELSLPVAPACNMMCSFCTKNVECLCNGNKKRYVRRPMTPRQAVNYALESIENDLEIKRFVIDGPGESLVNRQTFEVFRRLNKVLPNYEYKVSTNGLILNEKADELNRLNINIVDVSLNAIYEETISVLYSRIILGENVINDFFEIKEILLKGQLEGIKKCVDYGIEVNVNCMFFPGINDNDILAIASICKNIGVNKVKYISCYPSGKLKNIHIPTLKELSIKKEKISKLLESLGEEKFVETLEQ
jgi:nitrogen fixation protein NifB